MKNKRKILSLVMSILILIPSLSYGVTLDSSQELKLDYKFLEEAVIRINQDYPFELNSQKATEGALKGILQSLDRNSIYYNKEELEILESLNSLVGIGITLGEKNGYAVVEEVFEDGPAHKSGLKQGDILVEVDGNTVVGKTLSEIVDNIRGKRGTELSLKIDRNGEIKKFNLKRDLVNLPRLEYKYIGDIVYIRLYEFSRGVSAGVEKILLEARKKGINKVILDLRGNPGGYVDEAVGIADELFPRGELVTIKYKGHTNKLIAGKLKKNFYRTVMLVDENSASASELLAAAHQDRNIGKVVGRTTYGKGTVQNLIPYGDGGQLRLTVAEYLPPSGKSIDGVGLRPKYYVENKIVNGELVDLQLEKALEILKK